MFCVSLYTENIVEFYTNWAGRMQEAGAAKKFV